MALNATDGISGEVGMTGKSGIGDSGFVEAGMSESGISVEAGMTGKSGVSGKSDISAGIVEAILGRFPDAQAVYLFGSCGTQEERLGSDIDIALLLPPKKAKETKETRTGMLALDDLRFELESIHQKVVDLINLRMASTVLQKEVVAACRRIWCADKKYAADEFEMLTLSLYQKLNEERAGILMAAAAGGRFYGK